ncbi:MULTISPECIES: DEAD/DEAH box helicase family protein [unclassified Bradyrhizobium]|uniref:DEAD/DEAH box helicase family protein n=1 Tax=unclassified Bradyrhizobium TaxID=2631580 RepID=UPI00209FD3A9|nr:MULTISPECIES: DEAD/DEAH box helicase family protein [unclassified Bradyrhizobium]
MKGGSENEAPFLGNLSSLKLATEYRSLKDDPVRSFYRRCLLNSNQYKRAVGYFRSSVFVVIGPSIIEFARRGGRTRLICSPELTPDDIDSIVLGYAARNDKIVDRLVEQIDSLLAAEQTQQSTRVLATLVSTGAMDIKVAVRADRKGLYHEKIGIFSDGWGNRVSFKGSANETWSAWDRNGNFESIEVFCDWRDGLERERVKRHEAHFDSLWSEEDPDVEVFPFPSRAIDHLKRCALGGLHELGTEQLPSAEARRVGLPHQVDAIEEWKRRGRRGIFEHATGSGKTFTAILAIGQQVAEGLPTLIVVPSRLLLDQWAQELRQELPNAALLLAGSGNEGWRSPNRLRSMTDPDSSLGGRIVLSTMQTASLPDFLSNMSKGENLLIVADEVHQIGSPQNSAIMTISAWARLGLSATPVRYGDPEGTANIFSYFGEVVPPKISLMDAVSAGRLVPYEYYPHPVQLTATEADDWKQLTKAIQLEFFKNKADETGKKPLSERVKMLLIRRSRIAKKAAVKVKLAAEVLKANFEAGQSWLVYCEDTDQLSEVLSRIKQEGLEAVEYHSNMVGDRDATMSWFRSFGGILVSIKCLDEGVDIPAVSHALILASSQNPRQFIQRRGRVLRKSAGKQMATIHDAIVVPVSAEEDVGQLSLLRSELLRSVEFAKHAINRGADAELRAIAIGMGIDPDEFSIGGVEEDE